MDRMTLFMAFHNAVYRVQRVWWRAISAATGGRYCPHGAGFHCQACAQARARKETR